MSLYDLCHFDDENVTTETSISQIETESACLPFLECEPWSDTISSQRSAPEALPDYFFTHDGRILLLLERHVEYLLGGLTSLPSSWESMDASRTWIVYWCLHGLDILGALVRPQIRELFPQIVDFLSRCQVPPDENGCGGFGGGPGQAAHTVATYPAVMSLLIMGTSDSYKAINREALYNFYMKMKNPDGSFRVQEDGECDARSMYATLAVCDLLNLLTPELLHNCEEFLYSCQTYEGGFSPERGSEAHGGYTYCVLGALSVIEANRHKRKSCSPVAGDSHISPGIDFQSLRRWLIHRQMLLEGGFSGRINKLVDSCYSFWQGASFHMVYSPLRHRLESSSDRENAASSVPTACQQGDEESSSQPWMDATSLQSYVLRCCQEKTGGIRDKPGKRRDYYHTCYGLSGLSLAQHDIHGNHLSDQVIGDPFHNTLRPVHPIYNICRDSANKAKGFFALMAHPVAK